MDITLYTYKCMYRYTLLVYTTCTDDLYICVQYYELFLTNESPSEITFMNHVDELQLIVFGIHPHP